MKENSKGNAISRRTFFKRAAIVGAAGIAASIPGAGLAAKTNKKIEPAKPIEKFPDFKFKENKKFKILQFTDTHYIAGDPRSERAMKNVIEMLDTEKPDLVIHTGDVIFGKPAEESARTILQPIAERKIPWAVTLGNHDGEFGMTRQEIFDVMRSVPNNINTGVKGIYGISNDIITISSADGKKQWILYLFDTGNKTTLKGKGVKQRSGYDYVHFDQIEWYRRHSEEYAKDNGGEPVQSLAFFHIPFPEYNYATRYDTRRVLKGNYGEEPYSPNVNSGLWLNMRERGDVQATFCGHDHDNDYAMSWNETFLCFGRFSGCDTVYNDLKPSGARIIELTEGEHGFRSWIRIYGQGTTQDLKFPEDFETVL